MTKYEYQTRAVNQMRSIFEVRIEPGLTAGEMFKRAKERALKSLQLETEAALDIDFDRFNAGYMPHVKADTVFEAIDAGEGERRVRVDARNEARQAARKAL